MRTGIEEREERALHFPFCEIIYPASFDDLLPPSQFMSVSYPPSRVLYILCMTKRKSRRVTGRGNKYACIFYLRQLTFAKMSRVK